LRDRIGADSRRWTTPRAGDREARDGRSRTRSNAIAALNAEHHKQEKAVVGYDAQLQHATDERRVWRRRRAARARAVQAEEERDALDRRQDEARASIARLGRATARADERLTAAQRRLFEAREAPTTEPPRRRSRRRACRARRAAPALASEVQRLERRARSSSSVAALAAELDDTRAASTSCARRSRRRSAARRGVRARDCADVLRPTTRSALRVRGRELEPRSRTRAALDRPSRRRLRARRRARDRRSDLRISHTCEERQRDARQVLVEVDISTARGDGAPATSAIAPEESRRVDDADGCRRPGGAVGRRAADAQRRGRDVRCERRSTGSGSFNMMAIEQFDELETRHTILTTQRKDLVDSIAQTSEAIKRIDETTRSASRAFAAINRNFQRRSARCSAAAAPA
jgi:chromosome segregation protein